MEGKWKHDFQKGLRHGLPICLGYVSVAFTFGMMAVSNGLTLTQGVLISLFNVTSAGQLAGLQLMAAGGGLVEMGMTQLVINLRYALMSIALSQKMDGTMTTPRRLLMAFVNTDEVFAVASGQPGKVGWGYMLGLITLPYMGWALGTLLGAAAGETLPGNVVSALGIAIYGMFLAIIVPPAKKQRPVALVVAAAVGLSLMIRYVPGLNRISGGFAIIICAVLASALGAALYPVKEGE